MDITIYSSIPLGYCFYRKIAIVMITNLSLNANEIGVYMYVGNIHLCLFRVE